jgi:hypothetical protein
MLVSLSDQVSECLRHAEDCVQQATSQTDPKSRQDYLIIGACWLKLSSELWELANSSEPKRQGQQFTAPAKLDEGMGEEAFPVH